MSGGFTRVGSRVTSPAGSPRVGTPMFVRNTTSPCYYDSPTMVLTMKDKFFSTINISIIQDQKRSVVAIGVST